MIGKTPIIGITTSVNESEYVINRAYADGVRLGGGTAVFLPVAEDDSVLERYLDMTDGILFSGGTDILPVYFGEFLFDGYDMPYELTPERDRFEISLFCRAEQRKMPILGICRGIQLMAVAGGGNIYQDIDKMMLRKVRIRHSKYASADSLSHPVMLAQNSVLSSILGQNTLWVNSMHHQAVRRVPEGYRISATSPDGVIEAIESINDRFAVGVQWHPERLLAKAECRRHRGLFTAFVKAAGQYRDEVDRYGNINTKESRIYN